LRDILGDLRLGPGLEPNEVTIGQLLTHTSGIDCADDFTDTGNGSDALSRFIEDCVSGSRLLHRPGEYWSYSNCGFILLGRLIEISTGSSWEEEVMGRIIKPLGLSARTVTLLDGTENLAIGHRVDVDTGAMVEESRFMAKSGGPAGSNLIGTAEDLVEFADGLLD
jgi:CubicO group peptidase (beta-lactamase class C family)